MNMCRWACLRPKCAGGQVCKPAELGLKTESLFLFSSPHLFFPRTLGAPGSQQDPLNDKT